MNHGESNERDDLWELMGRARPVKVTPRFASNVLRAIRTSEAEPEREPGFLEWLFRGWNWLPAAGAAAMLLLIAVGSNLPAPVASGVATATIPDEAIEDALQGSELVVVSNLDLLLALDEKNPWLESSLSF